MIKRSMAGLLTRRFLGFMLVVGAIFARPHEAQFLTICYGLLVGASMTDALTGVITPKKEEKSEKNE